MREGKRSRGGWWRVGEEGVMFNKNHLSLFDLKFLSNQAEPSYRDSQIKCITSRVKHIY